MFSEKHSDETVLPTPSLYPYAPCMVTVTKHHSTTGKPTVSFFSSSNKQWLSVQMHITYFVSLVCWKSRLLSAKHRTRYQPHSARQPLPQIRGTRSSASAAEINQTKPTCQLQKNAKLILLPCDTHVHLSVTSWYCVKMDQAVFRQRGHRRLILQCIWKGIRVSLK